MLTLAHLQHFCALSDVRSYLNEPMAHEGRLYASNGHIIITVPDTYETQHNPIPGEIKRFIAQLHADHIQADNYRPVADIPLPEMTDLDVCPDCNGNGQVWSETCEDCDGVGTFGFGSHSYTCKECDGTGHQPGTPDTKLPCTGCHTTGRYLQTPIPVGLGHFQHRYLRLIATLPDCELATHRTNPAHSPAIFRFTGGFGALMPTRV